MKPKTYFGSDYIAGETNGAKIMVTAERFVVDFEKDEQKDIDIPVEKLGTETDDLWKNYVTGLLWIIGVRV